MGLRDEFADAVDSIRDLQFHATRVSKRSIIESFFVSFSTPCLFTAGKMRSRMFFYEQCVGPANDSVKAGNS